MVERRFEAIAAYRGRVSLPERKTAGSAGYDLEAAEDVVVHPGEVVSVPTGLKAYIPPGEVLLLTIRSSLAVKRSLMLANGIGVIDADYVDNPENEGHIKIAVFNFGSQSIAINRGTRIAQGLFIRYLTTVDDLSRGERTGGFGSTGV